MPHPRTPEAGVPFVERLKRMLPSILGGYGGDVRLPMEIGSERDPRLGAGSVWDAIRGGYEQVRDLGKPDPGQSALEALKRQAGVLKK
jgi:hypothetical protein